ncbi:hypothetical protein L227DRAFT_574674, partial [Lentinus tigrinus ALCF2SS1-6]
MPRSRNEDTQEIRTCISWVSPTARLSKSDGSRRLQLDEHISTLSASILTVLLVILAATWRVHPEQHWHF